MANEVALLNCLMNKGWQKLFTYWNNIHYTTPILFSCSALAIYFGIKYLQQEKIFRLFIFYCISSILLINITLDLISNFLTLKGKSYVSFLEIINSLFALIEIAIFLFFFNSVLNTRKVRAACLTIGCIFALTTFIFWLEILLTNYNKHNIRSTSYLLNYFELLILLVFCLIHFYDIFSNIKYQDLPISQNPSIWISSGIFFYCVVSLPSLLIGEILMNNKSVYFTMGAIHYVAFSILFIFIAKAFSCKTSLAV